MQEVDQVIKDCVVRHMQKETQVEKFLNLELAVCFFNGLCLCAHACSREHGANSSLGEFSMPQKFHNSMLWM